MEEVLADVPLGRSDAGIVAEVEGVAEFAEFAEFGFGYGGSEPI